MAAAAGAGAARIARKASHGPGPAAEVLDQRFLGGTRPSIRKKSMLCRLVSTWARIWARICPKDLPKAQSWPTGFFCVSKGNRAEDSLIMDGQDRKEDYKTT